MQSRCIIRYRYALVDLDIVLASFYLAIQYSLHSRRLERMGARKNATVPNRLLRSLDTVRVRYIDKFAKLLPVPVILIAQRLQIKVDSCGHSPTVPQEVAYYALLAVTHSSLTVPCLSDISYITTLSKTNSVTCGLSP